VIKISNPDTIKYLLNNARQCAAQIERGWSDNLERAQNEFDKLNWFRKKFSFLFAKKEVSALQKAQLENGLHCLMQHTTCKKFIRQVAYTTTFYLGKNDTVWLWAPELWEKYGKSFIPVIEKVF
jgi:hypothetical protein